jgi:RHS repeat-associated protein
MDDPTVLRDGAGFTGHLKDSNTGLNYMQARYYDPVMGRFLSIDPVGFVGSGGQPSYFNRYAYSANDPINHIDPDGQFWGAVSKAFKVAVKGGDVASVLAGAKQDIGTLTSSDATGLQKLGAGASLLTEIFSPVSARDAKAGAKFVKNKVGCKGCFVAGTLIDTEDGLRPIEDIKVGDLVWAQDEDTGEIALKAVTDLVRPQAREIYTVEVDSENAVSSIIGTTDDHPWWVVGQGWLRTDELISGMEVITRDGRLPDIKEVSYTSRIEPAFNLTVADFETYFVGENRVLVHNCGDKFKQAEQQSNTGYGHQRSVVVGNNAGGIAVPKDPMSGKKLNSETRDPGGDPMAQLIEQTETANAHKRGLLRKIADIFDPFE